MFYALSGVKGMKKMDIVILANYTMDFSSSDNGRFSYLANILSNKDNDVELITSDFYHITKKPRDYFPQGLKYKVTFIHETGYPKNVCLTRFYSHKVWAKNVKKYFDGRRKPDVIYCSVPSLDGPLFVAKYCERNNIRFIIDIQDLWPEAFQMIFNVPILSKLLLFPLKSKAESIYKRADAICAVSDTYCQRAARVNKKVNKTTTVFLGTELATFDKFAAETPVLEKKEGEIWIAYCGTLGSSYDLMVVIDALSILNNEKICFIVMGDGPKIEEFKSYALEKKINANFVGRLKYDEMCSLLCICDITVNPITHLAAQSIINKHADYAFSGLPVVSTQESEEYRQLVNEYEMGFNCNNGDAKDLAEKIATLANDEILRKKMGMNARRCGEERFDRSSTYKLLEEQILQI